MKGMFPSLQKGKCKEGTSGNKYQSLSSTTVSEIYFSFLVCLFVKNFMSSYLVLKMSHPLPNYVGTANGLTSITRLGVLKMSQKIASFSF